MTGTLFSYQGPGSYGNFVTENKAIEGLNLLVNFEMAGQLATQTRLAERGLKVAEETNAGLTQLSADVANVENAIEKLGGVVQQGFHILSRDLNGIHESLEELVKIAKTPDQTWAMEQYTVAGDAFERGFSEEALDYVNRAIDGYGEKSGFKLESRFYILRGLIRLGGSNATNPDIVDPKLAKDDFDLAIKYGAHLGNETLSRYHDLAGWACYCLGEMEQSTNYLEKSVELNRKNASGNFNLAKVLLHKDEVTQGLEYFGDALKVDWMYGVRASADEDFLKHEDEVSAAIEIHRIGLRSKLSFITMQYEGMEYHRRAELVSNHDIELSSKSATLLDSLISDAENSTVDALVRVLPHADRALEETHQELVDVYNQLSAKKEEGGGKRSWDVEASGLAGGFLGAIIGFFLGLTVHWVLAIVLLFAGGWIGNFIGVLLHPFVMAAETLGRASSGARKKAEMQKTIEKFGEVKALL